MRDVQQGDYVLDTDGAHYVPDVRYARDVRWQPTIVEAPAVADAGHGAPRGPRSDADGSETDGAYDQSPYPAPEGYVRLNDVPWIVRRPTE